MPANPKSKIENPKLELTRRALLQGTSMGLGSLALNCMLSEDARGEVAQTDPLAPKTPHHKARAKSVIFLHMVGAPSQLDLFDYKPTLQKFDGEPCPKEFLEGKRFAFLRGHPSLLGTKFKFARHGQSGLELSELLPHLASVADDIAVVKTLHTEQINHGPAQLMFHTGFGRFGRPSVGSWVSYGLGSENRDLPAYVVMITGKVAGGGSALWGNGFLPSVHQGVEFRSQGDPVLFLSDPPGITRDDRRRLLNGVQALNREQLADVGDPEIATRISQYEMAFRMQSSVPELMDLAGEKIETLELYGAKPGQASFANNCLLARRLVERGVRFVQLFHADWDTHSNIETGLPARTKEVDQPMAALVADLKQRGLLDETLVVWGAEFGRTPMMQGTDDEDKPASKPGRDHHKDAFSVWMAGGGVKPGVTVGRTDDLGYTIVEDPVHVNDFHATLLHLLGIDHERLTFKFQGRPYRLTDVAGEVVRKLIA
ncbi:MAG TPA: DUF1501 domain-containing protein [Pirellulaceae bacterium]|nr:DUF1501 domain-containing protein [Pirellulaceae bacterium]